MLRALAYLRRFPQGCTARQLAINLDLHRGYAEELYERGLVLRVKVEGEAWRYTVKPE